MDEFPTEFIVTQIPNRFTSLEEAEQYAADAALANEESYWIIPVVKRMPGLVARYQGVIIMGEGEN